MYEMQTYSHLLSPVPVEQGPPYPPGMWTLLNQHENLDACVEGFERIFALSLGDTRKRLPEEYRIVQRNTLGVIRKAFDIHGVEMLISATPLPIAA
jgi:hypothetical protein